MRLNLTRDFYIPPNATKVETINGVDIYQYVNSVNRLAAVCFIGRAVKPNWRYSFNTLDELTSYVDKTIEKYRAWQKRKADAKIERQASKAEAVKIVAVGDIFVESSHFEYTVIDFWQVVTKRGSKVELRKLTKTMVSVDSSGRNEDYMPDIDSFTDKTMSVSIRGCYGDRVYLKCESWYSITSWDGKPEYQTNSYWR